jgi:RNA polymerase sigma-70 factor (ECF subfamily)
MSQYLLALASPLDSEHHEERSSQAPGAGEDTMLLDRYFAGDNAALVELYDRHHHRLYLYCLKLLGSTEQAEDLTQELWEKVARLRAKPQHVLNPAGFFLTIARNLCFNQLKARKRFSPLDSLNDSAHPTYEIRELTEMEDLVVSALAKLPEDYREVLILNLYSGYRLDEIAGMLGKSPDAIRKRASRARLQLRTMVMEMIEERGGDASTLASLNRPDEEDAQ